MIGLRYDLLYFLDSLDGLNRDLRSRGLLGGFCDGSSLKKSSYTYSKREKR